VIFETSIIQLPLVLLVILSSAVIFRSDFIFFLAFLCGFLIDALLFRTLGVTSLFFLLFVFVIFLYEKRFELRSIQFIFVFSFFGAAVYLLVFGFTNLLLQLLGSTIAGVLIFLLVSLFDRRVKKEIELPSMV
jgi:rod shape-determining protein MreD